MKKKKKKKEKGVFWAYVDIEGPDQLSLSSVSRARQNVFFRAHADNDGPHYLNTPIKIF